MEADIIKTLVVSVSHLSVREREMMEDIHIKNNLHLVTQAEEEALKRIRTQSAPWLIYVSDYAYCVSTDFESRPLFLSNNTRALLLYAKNEHGVHRVEFDVDGTVINEFETYDIED